MEQDPAVQDMVLQLQTMILTLREEHGVSCAVLGKDGRVVVIERQEAKQPAEEDEVKQDPAAGILGRTGHGVAAFGRLGAWWVTR